MTTQDERTASVAWTFERVAGPFSGAADGPAWDGEALFFSLVEESRILRYDPATGAVDEVRKYTARTKGLAFTARGDLIGCQAVPRRLVRFNRDGSSTPLEAKLDGHFHNFPDDLVVDSRGRIWFSDPNAPEPGSGPQHPPLEHASVLRWERGPDRIPRLRRMTYDTTWPRGVLVAPDERTLYVADSPEDPGAARELRAYPIVDHELDGDESEEDALGTYRVLHAFGSDHRGPHRGIDGMCLDSEGNVVACAGWQRSGPGPMLYVFAPSGRILETHPTPDDEPTNCAFGGHELEDLYVTTAAGNLYRVSDTGRRGYRTGRTA